MKVVSQNLSIMMTDIQGYTDTSSVSSREEIVQLLRNHNRLMVPVIQFYGGTIIKSIGDALLVTFNSATDAVVCGIIIQLILREYNKKQRGEGQKMSLRVVINSGDVTLENRDIFGDAVNITARMEGLPCFPGGTIGISESTFLLMNRNEIVADLIGPQQMKGIPTPINVFIVPLEKQRLNEIPTRLLELVEHVVQHQGSLTSEFDNEINKFLQHSKLDPTPSNEMAAPPPRLADPPQQVKPEPVAVIPEKSLKQPLPDVPATVMERFKGFLVDFWMMLLFVVVFRDISPIIIVLYFVTFWKIKGQSIGQNVMGLQIRTKSGQMEYPQAFFRAILFLFSPFFFFMAFFGKGELIQDIVTGTIVFKNPEAGKSESNLTPAKMKVRFKGFLLDSLVIIVLFIILKVEGGIGFTLLYLTLFWKFKGSSIGMAAYDLEVKTKSGEPLVFFRALFRAIVFCCSPVFFFFPFIGKGELIQDIAANTIVTTETEN